MIFKKVKLLSDHRSEVVPFWKTCLESASSGLLGKLLMFVLVCLGISATEGNIIEIPENNKIVTTITTIISYSLLILVSIFSLICLFGFPIILEWIYECRQQNIEGLKLKKEILELEQQKKKFDI